VKFTEADIKAAKVAFDTAKVPLGDRFCVVNPKYADDLTSITNFVSVDKVPQQPGAIYYGYVGQAHGIQFIMMDNCPLVDDDGTISATAGNNTNKCAIFYHRLAAAAAMQKRFSQKIQPHALATKDLINIWSGWGEVVLNSNFIYVKYDPTDNDA
jgi:N4-gp56 family major capsid protein